MNNIEASDIRVQDLDHCGLIAGICDEIGLVEKLDRLLGTHPQEIVTPTSSSQSHDSQRIGICQTNYQYHWRKIVDSPILWRALSQILPALWSYFSRS